MPQSAGQVADVSLPLHIASPQYDTGAVIVAADAQSMLHVAEVSPLLQVPSPQYPPGIDGIEELAGGAGLFLGGGTGIEIDETLEEALPCGGITIGGMIGKPKDGVGPYSNCGRGSMNHESARLNGTEDCVGARRG